MLPAAHRLTDASSFRVTTRRGRRASARLLVVHVATSRSTAPARAGLVVSRAVGNAVERNRVKRRLRHLLAARLPMVAHGTSIVVRALPASASAGFNELGRELDRCLAQASPTKVTA